MCLGRRGNKLAQQLSGFQIAVSKLPLPLVHRTSSSVEPQNHAVAQESVGQQNPDDLFGFWLYAGGHISFMSASQ